MVDFGDRAVREAFGQIAQKERADREGLFRRIGLDAVNISAMGSYADPLMQFFKMRAQKIRV